MYFAIAHIQQPAPIVRPGKPAAPKAASSTPSPSINGAVFEMPAGLPPFLKKLVTVPVSDKSSEFAALNSVARQVSVPFTHKGPDYALYGTQVPFGKPVPAYEFLWTIGRSYIPGTINVNGSGAITAVNQKTNS
jgi:hypothetical protein